MTEVTVLFLDGTFSSTAIGPMEVFPPFRHVVELSHGNAAGSWTRGPL